jgi:hypothetical protein
MFYKKIVDFIETCSNKLFFICSKYFIFFFKIILVINTFCLSKFIYSNILFKKYCVFNHFRLINTALNKYLNKFYSSEIFLAKGATILAVINISIFQIVFYYPLGIFFLLISVLLNMYLCKVSIVFIAKHDLGKSLNLCKVLLIIKTVMLKSLYIAVLLFIGFVALVKFIGLMTCYDYDLYCAIIRLCNGVTTISGEYKDLISL